MTPNLESGIFGTSGKGDRSKQSVWNGVFKKLDLERSKSVLNFHGKSYSIHITWTQDTHKIHNVDGSTLVQM
jgi:hypothetical protein